MPPNTKNPALKAVLEEVKAKAGKSKKLRAAIEELEAESRAIENAPLNFQDFKLYLRRWIECKGEEFASTLQLGLIVSKGRYPYEGAPSISEKPWVEFKNQSSMARFSPLPPEVSVALERGWETFSGACFFMPETVFERLAARMEIVCGPRWGSGEVMPIAQRETRLKGIADKLAELRPALAELQAEIDSVSDAIQAHSTDDSQ